MREVSRRRAGLGVVPLVALLAIASARCGGEATRNGEAVCTTCQGGGSSGANAGGLPSVGGASSTGGAIAMGGMTQVATGGLPNGFGCPGIPSEPPPVSEDTCGSRTECECILGDTYFLIERSARMLDAWGGTTRWEYLKEALSGFRRSTAGAVAFSGGFEPSDGDVCNPDLYAQPALVFNNGTTAALDIVHALSVVSPAGKNPLHLAFVQLVNYLAFGPGDNSGPTTIVLVTATPPDDCPNGVTVDDLAGVITNSRGVFRGQIVTVALGADYDVDVLAKAAGTLPFRIAANEPPHRLLEVLEGCGLPPVQCEDIALPSPPPGRGVDLESLWVGFDTPRGVETPPRLSGPEECASSLNGGYYLDTSSDSTLVRLCPCTCPLMRYCSFGAQFRCPAL